MDSIPNSSFKSHPTPQTTDTYSPELLRPRPNSDESPASIRPCGWEDGRRYKTRSGIYVRSKIEKIIDKTAIERPEAPNAPNMNQTVTIFEVDLN